jgi:hypothetical protein
LSELCVVLSCCHEVHSIEVFKELTIIIEEIANKSAFGKKEFGKKILGPLIDYAQDESNDQAARTRALECINTLLKDCTENVKLFVRKRTVQKDLYFFPSLST